MKTTTVVLSVVVAITTGFAIYYGKQNANYITDWTAFLDKNKSLDLSMVKYLPKP